MTIHRATLAPLLTLLVGCVAPEPEIRIGVQVSHLTSSGPQAGLPADADTLRFLVMKDHEVYRDFFRTVVNLTDLDGDGATDREALVEIPPDADISITVHAHRALDVLATARVDGINIRRGERRYVSLTFTPIRKISTLPLELPSGRFGHGAARIESDGRVLVTGGFTSAAAMDCPASLSSSVACFELHPSDEAFLVEPSDGTVYEARQPMLRPRALHTATSLGDGRVLIAGGLSGAVLGLERISGAASEPASFEYRIHVVPVPEDSLRSISRTFEIFDPLLNQEEADTDRNGDPQAGGFIGAPGEPDSPGQMNAPRYLHAATLLPGSDDEVMIVGGQGSAESSVTGELFILERTGGSGFRYPPILLSDPSVARVWPTAATTDTHVYVIGGVYPPTSTPNLLNRWHPGEPPTPSGSFSDLTFCPGADVTDRPSHALVGASSAVFGVDGIRRILVAGWQGPLCEEPPDGSPATTASYNGTVACADSFLSSRSFWVGTDTCTFGCIRNPEQPHLLGPAVGMPNGQALIAGGFSDGALHVTSRVELLTGRFEGAFEFAERDTTVNLELSRGRAWHTATTLFGGRVLFVGGMNFIFETTGDLPESIDFSSVIEIYDPGWDPTLVPTPE